jgi:SAM-dependent methyltransferase
MQSAQALQPAGRYALLPAVVAAEPDARMRAVLVRSVLDVLAVGAGAEALPFADDTFDAVAVSSAWHWMDLVLTVPEAARALRSGGRLGVLWNGPARDVEWVAELLGPGRERVGRASDHANRHRVELPFDAPFTTPETTVITWSMPR